MKLVRALDSALREPKMIAQSCMNTLVPTPLLGGLSPQQFMRRYWQKKPLLVRAAMPSAADVVDRATLFALASQPEVEARLVVRNEAHWSLRHGPFARRALPGLKTPAWTLLVQGADLHLEAAHRLLQSFRFVPDARLDDLMFSFATDGGGVGPHIDSYDVFLLQVRGRRHWRIGRLTSPTWRDDVPLKMLASFAPTDDWLLEPGDMLYLPPGWAHDGIADGEAITASIGFRSAGAETLGVDVLQHLLDGFEPPETEARYGDRGQPATSTPARIPATLQRYAQASVERLVGSPRELARSLGEALSEPKPGVWFESTASSRKPSGLHLDRRTRMLYDDHHVFINGEAFRTAGRDAKLVRRLADDRKLAVEDVVALSSEARTLVGEWAAAGWLHPLP